MKLCPFCDDAHINRVLDESELVKVMFSNPRLTEGHLLVVSKRHIEEPWDLTTDEYNEIFKFTTKYQQRLASTLGTGCDVRQNYRPFLVQGRLKVDHVHYHLIPRIFEDEIYEKTQIYEKDIFSELTQEEVTKISAILKP